MPKNVIWQHYFARKFSASRFEIVIRVFVSDFYWQHFRARIKHMLVLPSDGNHADYFVPTEWNRFSQKVYRGACGSYQRFRRYVGMIKQTQRASLRVAEGVARQPLNQRSWQQLGKLWRQWDHAHLEHFLKPIWIPFIIEPFLAKEAERILQRKAGPRFTEAVDTVFSPDQPNAVTHERRELLILAIKIRQHQMTLAQQRRAIQSHAAQYGFIPCYDVIDAPWTEQHFRHELNTLLRRPLATLRDEENRLRTKFEKNKHVFSRLLKPLSLTTRERDVLKMAHDIVFIKDERDDYRRRQSLAVQPLYAELARRFHLPFRAPLYLIHREVEQWFASGRLPVKRTELLQRMRGYCLEIINNEPVQIRSGLAMRRFLAKQKFSSQENTQRQLRGTIGNRGTARGRVALVRTVHDLRRVKDGDVLVAVTTNPDYVPAMRKACAIITDEGGLTCHAAIVARELNVPCLVGTKIATKKFRDGDRVVVDATHGVVRKLS